MKSKILRVLFIMVALTLISSCFVGSTFAKFMTTAKGSSTATVATWKFRQVDVGVINNSIVFDLFDKDNVFFLNPDGTVGTTKANTLQQPGAGEAVIAPGTGGKFVLKIVNESDVKAQYNFVMSEVGSSGLPIKYSLDNSTNSANWKAANQIVKSGVLSRNDTAEITVYWRWLADDGGSEYADKYIEIEGSVTFMQID